MTKKEICDFINDLIRKEKGNPIKPDDKIVDAHLDSLGLVSVLIEMDIKFPGLLSDEGDTFTRFNDKTLKEVVYECKKHLTETEQ